MQEKVLHEATLSQAAARTQLETTAQPWTLAGETALGEPEDVFASSQHTGMLPQSCSPA